MVSQILRIAISIKNAQAFNCYDNTRNFSRPPEIEDRLLPGHWEGDLIKGADYRSSVGTLVERTTGFVEFAKMDIATNKAVIGSFAALFNRERGRFAKT